MRISDWSSDVCSSDLHFKPMYMYKMLAHVLDHVRTADEVTQPSQWPPVVPIMTSSLAHLKTKGGALEIVEILTDGTLASAGDLLRSPSSTIDNHEYMISTPMDASRQAHHSTMNQSTHVVARIVSAEPSLPHALTNPFE